MTDINEASADTDTDAETGVRWANREVVLQPPGLGDASKKAVATLNPAPSSLIKPVEKSGAKPVLKGLLVVVVVVGVGLGAVVALRSTGAKKTTAATEEDAPADEAAPPADAVDAVRAAQMTLRDGLMVAKVHYTDVATYATLSAATLEAIEPTLDFDIMSSADADTVGLGDLSESGFVMVSETTTGTWYCIAETPAGTTFGQAPELASIDTVAECAQPEWTAAGV